ncbi:hypothetical protein E2C01_061474 [Portunus trituberculatus]|uniref:Uncharacterized protein n=1 Tax=Portunus trituberculatus TaxID=210409 RepID=A0A5B7H3Y9_PORTR|nr:hypothetical protein [Portunus trituberculatus]
MVCFACIFEFWCIQRLEYTKITHFLHISVPYTNSVFS